MKIPDPLDDVFATQHGSSSSVLKMHTSLFQLGRNRSLKSGTTTAKPDDLHALEDHARAMARETYRDRYDPTQNTHDAMHQSEYERALAQREEAEQGRDHSAANLRDAESALADVPKAGPRPAVHPLLIPAFIVTVALTVAPTLHDSVFHTLPDDMLAWFVSLLGASFVGWMLTLAILHGRQTKWTQIGTAAGIAVGLGLCIVRLSTAETMGEVLYGIGLTMIEIAAVLLLELQAIGLRIKDAEWQVRHEAESKALARRDAAAADSARWETRLQAIAKEITDKIAFVEDRHNRHIHIAELEAVAIKAVQDGYNSGIAENLGRVRGVGGNAS